MGLYGDETRGEAGGMIGRETVHTVDYQRDVTISTGLFPDP